MFSNEEILEYLGGAKHVRILNAYLECCINIKENNLSNFGKI